MIQENVYKSVSRWNLLWKKEKEEKTLLNLLSISTIGLLIIVCCLGMRFSNDNQWGSLSFEDLIFKNDLIIWFNSREYTLSWDLPLRFWK